MAKRPAEQLASAIERQLGRPAHINNRGVVVRVVPRSELGRWLKLVKSIDARFRLDGSPLNKRRHARG